jgi:hypothetical protein
MVLFTVFKNPRRLMCFAVNCLYPCIVTAVSASRCKHLGGWLFAKTPTFFIPYLQGLAAYAI